MRVTGSSDGQSSHAQAEIFSGGDVWVRPLAGAVGGQHGGDDADFNCAVVQFGAGARTKNHTHSSEQMLYVLSGIGKVGNAEGERVISAGDFAIIPPGEEHWHGAGDTGSPMTHLAITRRDSITEVTGE